MGKLYVIAGHGAGDPGAQGNGYSEAERVRALATRMKAIGGSDVEVLDTSRNWYEDGGISNLKLPRGSEIIELHMDSGVPSARGGHVLDKPGIGFDDYDRACASFISTIFPGRAESLRSQGLGNATRAYNKGYGYRLVECGFITNKTDLNTFNTHMDLLAKGLLTACGVKVDTNQIRPKENDLKAITIPKGTYPVYRLYNPNSGEHFFTSDKREYDAMVKSGWKGEDEAWKGADTGDIIYRMYNPNNGQHHWTRAFNEAEAMQKAGWIYEGANFASARDGKPVYRLYNPNNGLHHFTASQDEKTSLVKAGWKDEDVAWYAM